MCKESSNNIPSEIEKCIALLKNLVADTNQLFELPEEQRVALMKAAGKLSRPDRDEFQQRRKDAKKAAKRKMIERDKHARKTQVFVLLVRQWFLKLLN